MSRPTLDPTQVIDEAARLADAEFGPVKGAA